MASARHLLLQRRTSALQKNLLPKRASLTGQYTKRQLDGIAAYFVLVHAEIESYFEDKTLQLVDASLNMWTAQQRLSKSLFSMVLYYEGHRKGPPQSFDPNQFKDRKLDSLIHGAVAQHKSRIVSNNGIKEKDLCEILFPVGFSYTDLDSTLVASLDSFGQRRGNFAHQSLHRAITSTLIDPFVEATTVKSIVTGLIDVDKFFLSLAS